MTKDLQRVASLEGGNWHNPSYKHFAPRWGDLSACISVLEFLVALAAGFAGQTGAVMELMTLYRPVGQKELNLIAESGYRVFPPRLPGQPIFYPVLNEEYANQIARDWNAKSNDPPVGYVTRFQVRAEYISRFEHHIVGSAIHEEYWIPSEELNEFNQNIVARST